MHVFYVIVICLQVEWDLRRGGGGERLEKERW